MKSQTLDSIYKAYVQDVYRYLFSLCGNHHLAEDILQETFFRAYLYLEECQNSVKPWLYKVAYNAFIDYKRKHTRTILRDDRYFNNITYGKTPEEEVLKKEQLQEISNIIDQLPDNQRHAILLCDFHNLSYKSASEIMGVSLGHFKILLFRARQKIRTMKKEEF